MAQEEEINFDWEMRTEKMPFKYHMIAGCFAGLIEHVTMLPFDTIKTHQQVSKNIKIRDVIKHIYNQQKGGLSNFYRGIQVVATGCMPAHAAYFSVYEFSKIKLGIDDEQLHPYLFSLTGAIATFFHDLILTPADVIKQRQQISQLNSKEIFKQLKINEGLFSLIRSFKITYLINVPSNAILIAVNESLKVLSFQQNEHNFASYFACAGIAGGIASFCTTPLDVVKTKLQTQKYEFVIKNQKNSSLNNKNLSSKAPQFAQSTMTDQDMKDMHQRKNQYIKYTNFKQTCQYIMQEDGIKGFFRGAPTRMAMVAPSAAISWATYEQLKKILNQRHQDSINRH